MKITYATDINSADIQNWSGLGWYYREMLIQAGCEVNTVDKTAMPHTLLHKFKRHLIKNVQHKLYSPRFNIDVAKYYAQCVQRKVTSGTTILSPNTNILAYLKKDYKKVLFADATFDSLLHLYPKYKDLTPQCLREGDEIDRQAVANADLLVYTSQWAADSSIRHYGADPAKVFIVPFGANLDHLPSADKVESSIAKRLQAKHINLLFLGIEWGRKGGDYAMQVTTRLNELGFPATLHIIGVKNLPPHTNHRYIVNHGYISKATQQGQQHIGELLASSHFLLLPTLADCTPVACSEANAFGVPCITSDVGGLKSIIKDDINGRTFSHQHFVSDAVAYIISQVESDKDYTELCSSSYHMYETELNWKSVGRKITELIKNS